MLAVEADGGLDRALELARETVEIGTRFGSRDLMALGLQDQGRALIAKGEVKEVIALLDEATVAALSGELAPYTTGVIYCNMIDQCQAMADYGRAREWTEAASRWCDRMAIAGFPGMCRVHRADVIGLRGGWREAELEARNAFDELRNFHAGYAAEAQYVIGETRLWRGDLSEAREAFRVAHELGRDPNPGLALLQLAEGKAEAAATTIRRSLSSKRQPLGRARMLPAQLAIAVATDDRVTAEAVARELGETAKTYPTPALRAQALTAEAVISLMAGDSETAVRLLCEGLTLFRQGEAPYEGGEARGGLGSAYRSGGDPRGAGVELQAGRASLSRAGGTQQAPEAV